ncbi:hypothetical protein [Flavobacterium zepuense]|nr:hypothetical protein [Flavobacterium zepuense]
MNPLVNTFVILAISVIAVFFLIAATVNKIPKEDKQKKPFSGVPK